MIRLMGSMAIAGAGLPYASALAQETQEEMTSHQWQGRVLGAEASLQVFHTDAALAKDIILQSVALMQRLEKVFSLFDPQSTLSLLNRQGYLEQPDPDFLYLLRRSIEISEMTGGAFDISVQPLWLHYKQFGLGNKTGLKAAKERVGFDKINLSSDRVAFERKGMALTMNGIAQGYITDRVVSYMKARGVTSTLVDMGEYGAIGPQAGGEPWRIALADPFQPGGISEIMELENAALSTSGAYGEYFDREKHLHHLFDPENGQSANKYMAVTVKSREALLADALSTGFYSMDRDNIKKTMALIGKDNQIEARLTMPDGQIYTMKA